MDKELKVFLLKYIEGIDEEVYLNFITLFSKRSVKFVKKTDMSIYLKCKQFAITSEHQAFNN